MGEQNISIFLVFFTGLLAFTLVLSKFLHDRPRLGAIVPEAAMVLAVGMLAGFLIHLVAGQVSKADDDGVADDDNVDGQDVDQDLSALLSFSPEIFFIALLPPIIFNSGLRIGALFFRHFVPILGFAVFGTSIAAISTALLLKMLVHFDWCGGFYPTLTELLTFGALISSTDPVSTLAVFQAKRVDPQLFYLVFGESVLNDALCIVLFNAFSKFVSRDNNAASIAIGTAQFFLDFFLDSVGSLCLGICSGLATAYLFKQIDMRENRLIEISLYLLLVYVPFLLAEIMQLSGIVTILFTGISANRYIVPNLSQTTKVNADMLFRLLAHLAETSIFLELGLSVFGLIGHWNWKFIGWSLLVCLVARALNIYPIAYCFNRLLLTGGRDYEDLFIEHEMKRFRKASRLGTTEGEMSERFSPSVQTEIDEGMIISSSMSMRSSTSESSTVTATPLKRKDLKVRGKTQHMMWFSGLRGAVAYACVRTFPNTFNHQKDFIMTTMAIVLITVYIMGGTTETALNKLKIPTGVDEDQYMAERLREPVVPNALRNFEHKYIMPFVVRDFNVMQGIDGSECENTSTSSSLRHEPSPFIPHVEMTESGHLDSMEDYRKVKRKKKKLDLEKHMRKDSLFDYGAN